MMYYSGDNMIGINKEEGMGQITQVQSSYRFLLDHIERFQQEIVDGARHIDARVYQFPQQTDDDIGVTPESISLTRQEGEQAFELAQSHLLDHLITERNHGRMIPRLAGHIHIDHANPIECIQRIQCINQLKDDFGLLIQSLSSDKDVRFEIVKEALPNLIKLAATRHILAENRPLSVVSYSWSHRFSSKKLNKQEVLHKLFNTRRYSNNTVTINEAWSSQVDDDITYIQSFPNGAQFIIKRPLKITPVVNIKYQESDLFIDPKLKKSSTKIAHSPLYIFNNKTVKMQPFNDYVRSEHIEGKKAVNLDLVIPRLHLYQLS